MTSSDLAAFMQAHGIAGEILHLDVPTPTVETAAAAVRAQPDQIIKSLLLFVQSRPVLAICCGTRPIDYRKVADHFATGRRQVKFASAEMVESVTGYPAGGVPPFGHPTPIHTLIDPLVLDQPFVFGGGGDHHSLVKVAPAEIVRVTQAVTLQLLAP